MQIPPPVEVHDLSKDKEFNALKAIDPEHWAIVELEAAAVEDDPVKFNQAYEIMVRESKKTVQARTAAEANLNMTILRGMQPFVENTGQLISEVANHAEAKSRQVNDRSAAKEDASKSAMKYVLLKVALHSLKTGSGCQEYQQAKRDAEIVDSKMDASTKALDKRVTDHLLVVDQEILPHERNASLYKKAVERLDSRFNEEEVQKILQDKSFFASAARKLFK